MRLAIKGANTTIGIETIAPRIKYMNPSITPIERRIVQLSSSCLSRSLTRPGRFRIASGLGRRSVPGGLPGWLSCQFLQESRHLAGAEVVAGPPWGDRDAGHLLVHPADMKFELGRCFGVHGLAGGGQVLGDHAVDDLDLCLPRIERARAWS